VSQTITRDVAVVGLGPAGVAAAVSAAEAGARVLAIDEGSGPGGQIWRHHSKDRGGLPEAARQWLSRLEGLPADAFRLLRGFIFDAREQGVLVAATNEGTVRIQARSLVLATGARERFLPFPGWTLPGVLGVGGAQALVKSGASVRGQRVIVAGTGPLLLPVAATLRRAGARVVSVAEQASARRVLGFAARLVAHPTKIGEAIRYRLGFLGAPYATGCWVRAAHGREQVESVDLTDGRSSWTERCDLLACAFGLVPNLELARLLGCRVEGGRVAVGDGQTTSVQGVFAAGETCGIGGVDVALVEGTIAGLHAAGHPRAALRLIRRRARLRAFADRLEDAFSLRGELRRLAGPETLVCRCEDVALCRLRPEWTSRQAKLYTRAGMGPCQGRVCGSALEFLFGWTADTVRPPLFPVPLEALKEADA
jgi:D-hydroxyproline dehydrogenase subunit alpha